MKTRERKLSVEPLEDRRVLATFSVSNITINESTGDFWVEVYKSGFGDPIFLGFEVTNGSAEEGVDFVQVETFPTRGPFEDVTRVRFSVTPDAEIEPTESFAVTVAWLDGGLHEAHGQVLIENRTPLPCDLVDEGDGCDIEDLDALYAASTDPVNPDVAVGEWLGTGVVAFEFEEDVCH